MGDLDLELSRISKLFVDRDQASAEAALARRKEFAVTLLCGADVAGSYTLQLAVLTAAALAGRCFPGAVRAVCPAKAAEAGLKLWPSLGLSFGEALLQLVGPGALIDPAAAPGAPHSLVFGDAQSVRSALRVTFDGWIGKIGPMQDVARLPEREYFSAAGILAASLAISELFLSFADICVEAGRRTVGLSLWRPDFDIADPAALGVPVEYLPAALWVLGLGHLGNAYLWALATLPFAQPGTVEFFLNDFDKVEPENVETGILFGASDNRRFKTRACSGWLERRDFKTRLVERRFDGTFRRREEEPALALCGFDSNPARRDLASAKFRRVVESGLGGTAANFDTVSLHALPNPRPPAELWPDPSEEERRKHAEHLGRVARDNPGYAPLGKDECGRFDLAGKSVAVPFVGTTAASLVVAEAVRLLHDGPAYTDLKLSLGGSGGCWSKTTGNFAAGDAAGVAFVAARKL